MVIGTGIDIIELDRIAKLIDVQPKFLDRILTGREREKAEQLRGQRRTEFVAGRFAAKEAYAKAVGTGFGRDLSFLDIEIYNDERGKPVLHAASPYTVHVSISHSNQFAVAQVIIESPSS